MNVKEYADRSVMNKFSFWYDKIKDCGLNVPKSIIIKIDPTDPIIEHFYLDDYKEDTKIIQDWVDKHVVPEIDKAKFGLFFLKNSTFSNKFNAMDCLSYRDRVAASVININYAALCLGAGGIDEIVIRERIEHDSSSTPTIYNGLPFRTEFRVFYDFDRQKVLYTVNYWDYDYVYPNLHDLTDKIVFDYMKDKMQQSFEDNKETVEKLVTEHMTNVGLTGKWSIDFMLDESGKFWLIDMAVAESSAYWKEQ